MRPLISILENESTTLSLALDRAKRLLHKLIEQATPDELRMIAKLIDGIRSFYDDYLYHLRHNLTDEFLPAEKNVDFASLRQDAQKELERRALNV